jgi:Carboxypeptidase regulatory-like domain
MKFKNFILAVVFLSFAAAVNVQAQFNITGSLNGRVLSANGSGIKRTNVTVLNLNTLESHECLTNEFGYFRFNDLPILYLYLVTVRSKRYIFTDSYQLFEFTSLEHNMNFVSDY